MVSAARSSGSSEWMLVLPQARAIIVDVVPELPDHPMVNMVKGMPANTVLAMAAGQLPADKAAELKERITAL